MLIALFYPHPPPLRPILISLCSFLKTHFPNETFLKCEPLKYEGRTRCSVINYIHAETPQVENDNNDDRKQCNSQEAKLTVPTLHTNTNARAHTLEYTRTHARTHARTHTHTHSIAHQSTEIISEQIGGGGEVLAVVGVNQMGVQSDFKGSG